MLRRVSPRSQDSDVPLSISLLDKLWGRQGDGRDLAIGRGTDNDIILDSARCPLLVSRTHAVLSRRSVKLLVSDAGSTNGTFVNERRLAVGEQCRVREGDLISFGGPKRVKQAGQADDEPNPFVFQLHSIANLFSGVPPPPVEPAPIRTRLQAQGDVVDLTGGSSSSPSGPNPGPSKIPRKRARIQASAPIDLEDWSSEEEIKAASTPPEPASSDAPAEKPAEKAEGNSLMLKALEAQFECQICREFMVATHSLVPCGHMFCGECVGDWLKKKASCPSCRAATTAAPVPSLKVDNMLDEVVAPNMDAEAKEERQRRKESWTDNGPKMTERLKQQFSRGIPQASSSHHPFLHAALPNFDQLTALPGFQDIFMGSMGGRGPVVPSGARRRVATRQRPRGGAIAPPPPPPMVPAVPPPPAAGRFSIGMTPTRAPGVCHVCHYNLLGNQPAIVLHAPQHPAMWFHLHCQQSVPSFGAEWRANNGVPGVQLLPVAELVRLRGLYGPHTRTNARTQAA